MFSSKLFASLQSIVRSACHRKDEKKIYCFAKQLLTCVNSFNAPQIYLNSLSNFRSNPKNLNYGKNVYSKEFQNKSLADSFLAKENQKFRGQNDENFECALLSLSENKKLLSFLCMQASTRGLLLYEHDFWNEIIFEAHKALDNNNLLYALQLIFSCMFLTHASKKLKIQPGCNVNSESYTKNIEEKEESDSSLWHKTNKQTNKFLIDKNDERYKEFYFEWRFDSKVVSLYDRLNAYIKENLHKFFKPTDSEVLLDSLKICLPASANISDFFSSISLKDNSFFDNSNEVMIQAAHLVWYLKVTALFRSVYDLETVLIVCKVLKAILSLFSSSECNSSSISKHLNSFTLDEYMNLAPKQFPNQTNKTYSSSNNTSVLSPSMLVSIISSLGYMKFPNPELISVVCRNLLPYLSVLSFNQLAILVSKLSILDYKDANFCHILAKASVQPQTIKNATQKDIALILSAFNRMSFRDDELLEVASQRIINYIEEYDKSDTSLYPHVSFLLFNSYSCNNVLNIPLLKHLLPIFYNNLFYIPSSLAIMGWHDIVRMGVWVGSLRKAIKEKILRELNKLNIQSLAAATSLCYSHLGFYDSSLLFIIMHNLLTGPNSSEFMRFSTHKTISAANILWRAFYSIQWLASTSLSISNDLKQHAKLSLSCTENKINYLSAPWREVNLHLLKTVNVEKITTKRWDISSSSFHEEIHAALPVDLQNSAVFEVSIGPYMLDEVLQPCSVKKWIRNYLKKNKNKKSNLSLKDKV